MTKGAAELDLVEGAGEAQPETDRGREATQETLEALAAGISGHWMGGYGDLGSVPGIIGTAVMGVSVMEMVTARSLEWRSCTHRKDQGCG